jgi:hypothetical protein
MFEWLATKLESEYVIGTVGKEPTFKRKTPDIVYFRGNGTCELVDLAPVGGPEVEIIRGTWKIADGKLEMVLTSVETYGEGSEEELVPPDIEMFEFSDWQDTSFRVHVPTERMFEGIATELRREYLAGQSFISVPFVAGNNPPIELVLEEDGTYEFFFEVGEIFEGQKASSSMTNRGTWVIVDNRLELTQTSHQEWEDDIVDTNPPLIDSYEITDLQYMFDVPIEYARPFIQCDGLMYLGEQLTMRIGETQFWN